MYHHLRTQPHTISGPSPVFVVCGCLDEAEGGRPAVRPLHMFPIPPYRPSLSSFGLLVLSSSSPRPLLSSPLLSSPLLSTPLLCVCLPPCPPNCPLDFLFVDPLACLSVAWQPAKTILQSVPITPWETTSIILYYMAARSQLEPLHIHTHFHTHTHTHTHTHM